MANEKIPLMTDDVEVIAKLGNRPGSENKLQSPELKAKFDEASVLLKDHLNKVIGILNSMLGSDGGVLNGGNLAGPLNMNGFRLFGLSDPAETGDAVNKAYFDSTLEKLIKSGTEFINSKKKAVTVTLPAAGWAENAQSVNVEGVTAGNTILVGYSPDSFESYSGAGIRCTGQGAGTLSFVCESTPDADVNVNVVILN